MTKNYFYHFIRCMSIFSKHFRHYLTHYLSWPVAQVWFDKKKQKTRDQIGPIYAHLSDLTPSSCVYDQN